MGWDNHLSFHRTERFPKTHKFQCKDQKNPGQPQEKLVTRLGLRKASKKEMSKAKGRLCKTHKTRNDLRSRLKDSSVLRT